MWKDLGIHSNKNATLNTVAFILRVTGTRADSVSACVCVERRTEAGLGRVGVQAQYPDVEALAAGGGLRGRLRRGLSRQTAAALLTARQPAKLSTHTHTHTHIQSVMTSPPMSYRYIGGCHGRRRRSLYSADVLARRRSRPCSGPYMGRRHSAQGSDILQVQAAIRECIIY